MKNKKVDYDALFAKMRTNEIAKDQYSKRLNVLVHGLSEIINESHNATLRILEIFLQNGLKIERPITLVDVHRLGPAGQSHRLLPTTLAMKLKCVQS